jgi:hypothetical protein
LFVKSVLTKVVTLQFTFPDLGINGHNAIQADNGSCIPSEILEIFPNPKIHSLDTDGAEYTYTFTKAGTYWFICTIGTHCDQGMSAKVVVVAGASPTDESADESAGVASSTTNIGTRAASSSTTNIGTRAASSSRTSAPSSSNTATTSKKSDARNINQFASLSIVAIAFLYMFL